MLIFVRRGLFVVVVVSLLIYRSLVIYAGEDILNLKNESINPGSPAYSLKRVYEKAFEMIQFSKAAKINYLKSLLRIRLAELKYGVENKALSEIQKSSERFAYQAGVLINKVVKQNKGKERVIEDFKLYEQLLEVLRDKYPANSSFWMLIQHDINTMKILTDRLK